MDMDRYIGRLLDNRYEILEVIGSGGMSVVYKARCHRLNRLVAIKILKDENLQDEDFRRRFHAESQAVAMLSHPNIVSVYDVSTNSDEDYIVMELIDGITLKQYMEKKGVLNWKETLHFAIQIAKALEHAHSRGLVHRDIKPHNVMVLKNGSVKVTDFGIARIMSQSNTLTKEALGSVHYISPEQAKGGRVDNRSDLYSLGVVMYEMITGRPPYDGESPVSVAIQHINGGASRPSAINPNIPRGLEQIIMKAMARDSKKRYPNATAMLYDMDEFRKNPDMIFAVEAPKQDPTAATRIVTGIAAETAARETKMPPSQREAAVRNAGRTSLSPRQYSTAKPQQQGREQAATNRNSVATLAIIICSIVAMVAVVVFLMIIIGDSGNQSVVSVRVPKLVGLRLEDLPEYNGIEVVQQSAEYNSEYAAGRILRQEPEEGVARPVGTKVFVVVSLGPEPLPILVPNLKNATEESARQQLNSLDLDLYIDKETAYHDTVPAGSVIRSEPATGSKLENGMTVTLVISNGPRPIMAEMPDLLKNGGYDKVTAEGMMSRRGFKNVEFVEVNSLLPAGRVVSQSVEAGTQVDVNTHIVIEYSNGLPPEEIPGNPDDPNNPDHPDNPGETTGPDNPVEPDPSTGTEPEVDVTISYTFTDLPLREEPYKLSVLMGNKVVVIDEEIPAGQTSITLEITGSGVQECTIFVDGSFYKTEMVDFRING